MQHLRVEGFSGGVLIHSVSLDKASVKAAMEAVREGCVGIHISWPALTTFVYSGADKVKLTSGEYIRHFWQHSATERVIVEAMPVRDSSGRVCLVMPKQCFNNWKLQEFFYFWSQVSQIRLSEDGRHTVRFRNCQKWFALDELENQVCRINEPEVPEDIESVNQLFDRIERQNNPPEPTAFYTEARSAHDAFASAMKMINPVECQIIEVEKACEQAQENACDNG